MSLPLYIHGGTDVGRQRTQNEDCFRVAAQPDGSQLLVVCDGMGGHEAGEVASQVASDRIIQVLSAASPDNPPRTLYQAFVEANQAVVETARSRGVEGMGTTGVIGWVLGGRCYVGWVGDSRLYQFRDGALIDRTRDHTRVAQMVAHGILKPEEARHHPDAHVLVQALGGSAGVQKSFKPEVWTEPLELRAGDVLLLCSDGLYDFIEDPELYPLIEGRDYQDAVTRLIHLANERGGADNITAILLVVGQPEVPRMTKAPQEARRETLPEGMPTASVAEPPKSVPVAPVRAAPVSAPRRVESASLPVSQTAAPTGSSGRRVPLWWLLATGVVALGIGVAVGLRARKPPPHPEPGASSVMGADAGTGAAATVAPAPAPPVTEARGK
ncbi:protein phosphatase 2C domain-containing protein [Archangium sp.]|uniref:PP2C family protein-serine/threonine phosphatase n=1 Tax=Archangium sp. TaxID=1872627 RepID=UPI00286A8035|nr:protein phosphatase 2C domain-containing protein [Archangium sp.]